MIDLQALIGRACGQLTQREADRAAGRTDHDDMGGLLFFGNPMETTPEGCWWTNDCPRSTRSAGWHFA